MQRSRIKRTNSLLFAVSVCLTGAISLQAVRLPEAEVAKVLNGTVFRQVEGFYEDALPGKEWISGIWALLNYRFFSAGSDGVVVGRDDWLFSAEEYRLASDWPNIFNRNLAAMLEIGRQLADRNIALVVVPVPEKADIHSRQTGRISPHLPLDLYGRTVRTLRSGGISVVDIRSTLLAAADSGEQVFFRTDTHWKVRGAELAAREVARSGFLPHGDIVFHVERGADKTYRGDLTRFVPTGKAFEVFGPRAEELASPMFTREGLADELFAESVIDIALVGTSYSADPKWLFADWLQKYLGKELINHAAAGKGPLIPMWDFLDHELGDETDLTHVIWEVPVRYLLVQPDTPDQP